MAGAPLGNTNAAKAKRWEAALIRAIEAYPNEISSDGSNALMAGLNKAASEFVKKMIDEANLGFFREFGDRLDGKSAQSIMVSNPDGEEFKTVTRIENVIIDGNKNV